MERSPERDASYYLYNRSDVQSSSTAFVSSPATDPIFSAPPDIDPDTEHPFTA